MKKLVRILPFMENEEIKELAFQVINKEVEGVKLVLLFPFLRNEDLDEIVDLLVERKDGKNLQYALPFASHAAVEKIYKAVQEGEIKGIKESFLFPFLGKDQLKSMFNVFVKKAADEAHTKGTDDVHVHVYHDEDDDLDFDIDLDEDEIDLELDELKKEMKNLKKKLKELQKKE